MIEEKSSDKKGGGSLGLKGKKNGRRRRRRKEPEEISYLSRYKTSLVRIEMTFHNFSRSKITCFSMTDFKRNHNVFQYTLLQSSFSWAIGKGIKSFRNYAKQNTKNSFRRCNFILAKYFKIHFAVV
jgi:hypothetical protein